MSNTTTRERTPGDTSKSKRSLAPKLGVSLGYLEARTIIWPPIPLDESTRQLLMDVAESRSAKDKPVHVYALLSKMMLDQIEAQRPALMKEAAKVAETRAAEFTPEELVKEVAAAQRKLDRMTAALKAAKEKKA